MRKCCTKLNGRLAIRFIQTCFIPVQTNTNDAAGWNGIIVFIMYAYKCIGLLVFDFKIR